MVLGSVMSSLYERSKWVRLVSSQMHAGMIFNLFFHRYNTLRCCKLDMISGSVVSSLYERYNWVRLISVLMLEGIDWSELNDNHNILSEWGWYPEGEELNIHDGIDDSDFHDNLIFSHLSYNKVSYSMLNIVYVWCEYTWWI